MSNIIPQANVKIRPAVAGDLAFIDALQKLHSKNVGWMQTKAIETKIEKGEILIAVGSGQLAVGSEMQASLLPTANCQPPTLLGYCMASDRYFKHEDVGIIYQMNIVPGHQRGLIGASLLKAQFERSAYGCKLYCCWCAQDLAANKFWEAMGFVPLAFRAGSEKKARVHIFWQRRIRSGDESTPYWFPSQTTGGSIREDRLVLPIPPGVKWFDEMPRVMPKEEAPTPALPRGGPSTGRGGKKVKPKAVARAPLGSPLFFAPPVVEKPKAEKPKKAKRKNDPKMIAAARELRDKWLERVNTLGGERLLAGNGKYDVSRMLEASVVEMPQVKQIAA